MTTDRLRDTEPLMTALIKEWEEYSYAHRAGPDWGYDFLNWLCRVKIAALVEGKVDV